MILPPIPDLVDSRLKVLIATTCGHGATLEL